MKPRNIAAEFDSSIEEVTKPFEVSLTDEAVYAYAEIPSDRVYGRIGMLLDFIATHPYYGREYNPAYEAAMPPIPCRVFYCERYGVYYHVDGGERTITVLAIESQRKDPMGRFRTISRGMG